MASAREQRGLSTVVRVMTVVLAASCPLSGGGPAGRGVASNETDQDRRRTVGPCHTHLTRHTVTGHPIYVECSTYTSPPQNTYLVREPAVRYNTVRHLSTRPQPSQLPGPGRDPFITNNSPHRETLTARSLLRRSIALTSVRVKPAESMSTRKRPPPVACSESCRSRHRAGSLIGTLACLITPSPACVPRPPRRPLCVLVGPTRPSMTPRWTPRFPPTAVRGLVQTTRPPCASIGSTRT
jgi:hypothetical protein